MSLFDSKKGQNAFEDVAIIKAYLMAKFDMVIKTPKNIAFY